MRIRRPGWIFIVIMSVLILLSGITMPIRANAEGNTTDTLVVGVPTDRCPVFYVDSENGEVVGIGVDMMKLAASEAGFNTVFKAIGDQCIKQALDNPEYDVVMPLGSAITSTSGQSTIISDSLMPTTLTLVTLNEVDTLSINNLKIGMLSSQAGLAETISELYPGIEIFFYDEMSDCVKALRAKEVDALLHNSYVWSYVLQKPEYSKLVVQPYTMISMDFNVGMLDTAEGRAVMDRLNTGIAKIDDTKRQAIILDYATRKLYKYTFSDYVYKYWVYGLLLALLLISVLVTVIIKVNSMKREHEERMRNIIDTDPLTGVYSLSGFRKKAEELIKMHPDVPYMLSYNNIKDFKYINDRLGMEAGDELLRFWADQSKPLMTEEEAMGRIDADHFAVLRRIGGSAELATDGEQVFDELRNYFIKRGKNIKVQICTGIYVLMPKDYQDPDVDKMLDYARVVEKKVRDTKQDGYDFYNANQWEKGKHAADIVAFFPIALENGEFKVFYQPQIDYDTNQVKSAEALCRWKQDKLGWVPPSEFIPVLEDSGLIYEMDCFVWERVCQDLQRWSALGRDPVASVNVSRTDFKRNKHLPEYFDELIKKYDLRHDQLRIEITETSYVDDPKLLIKTTQRLREMGFTVEMDDFGSGYSSLNMLKEVVVDCVKLDLHFLSDKGDSQRGQIILKNITNMAHELGMRLVAEGVETKEQAEYLRSLGCTEMQGFYFHRPMSVVEFEELIENAKKR